MSEHTGAPDGSAAADSAAGPPNEDGGIPFDPRALDNVVYALADRQPAADRGARRDQFIAALRQAIESLAPDVRVHPAPVERIAVWSGPGDASSQPARLQLTAEGLADLGTEVQTYAVLGGGRLRIWFSRVDLPVGSAVLAVASGEQLVVGDGIVAGEPPRVEISLDWPDRELPTDIVLVVSGSGS